MSRKRPAPGASPVSRPQQALQPTLNFPPAQDTSALPNDQYLWDETNSSNNMSSTYSDPTVFDPAIYSANLNGSLQNDATQLNTDRTTFSGQLVRRNTNQQLTQRGRTMNAQAWPDFNSNSLTQQPNTWETSTDDEELERRALLARKDAQAKRKQIPPFVQKLSSFLDDGKNTDLIRWSDDGNSFIVVDEDEFAKTLIPELFKHNNYASFVRQLNMYGFHKKVGLTDNSMRASEKKSKAPSEYFNKYFKRGRPELLWLIQKPKNPGGGPKRKKDDDKMKGNDSDEEVKKSVVDGTGLRGPSVDDGDGTKNQELALIPISDFNLVRSELRTLQQQQKIIHNIINQMRQQNAQFYQQATTFQALHDRHENSINAILTFLATFYNRSLEGNSAANIADMFSNAIPQNSQSHGTVVDVDDYPETEGDKQTRIQRPPRRPLALLPAPGEATSTRTSSARSTMSPRPNSRQSIFRPFNNSPSPGKPVKSTNQPSIFPNNPETPITKVDAETPNVLNQLPDHDDIMSVIQNVNNSHARNNSTESIRFDFPSALAHYQTADGKSPLTPEQRNDMLSLIANSANAASTNGTSGNGNNALIDPNPPQIPSLEAISAADAQLELLQKMQEEQNAKVQNLADRLQPLTPSGGIPGLDAMNGADGMTSYFGNATAPTDNVDVDLGSFINNDDYFTSHHDPSQVHPSSSELVNDMGLSDLDFTFGDPGDLQNGDLFGDDGMLDGNGLNMEDTPKAGPDSAGGRIESVSSGSPSPTNLVDEKIITKDLGMGSPKKRRRVS